MNSKEIVKRTLDFERPERVAHSFVESDFIGVSPQTATYATEWKEIESGRWERLDQWGNTWSRIDPTSKGEVTKGILENTEDIKTYDFPDYSKEEDYLDAKKIAENSKDKWVIGGVPGFAFNIARKMRKLDQYLMDILLEPELISLLHDKIDAMLEDMINNYAKAKVDAIMFAEDWGTQSQTLVSPEMWHNEFFPRFKKLCSLAHEKGLYVMMHSCGMIEKIVPGLIEAGIDCLQFDQPDLHGIDNLAAYQENSKITFWSPVDIQKTLQTKDEKIIREKAREMLDKLWRGHGGFIAGYYGDNTSIGLEPKWQEIASEEFREYGTLKNFT